VIIAFSVHSDSMSDLALEPINDKRLANRLLTTFERLGVGAA
jgi:hypothetical protein